MKTVCLVACLALGAASVAAQTPVPAPFEPRVGMPGKDVVWVPTSPELVEVMLDMAGVAPDDFVMDLGSGDGRNIIAAARRGARGLGVEFNADMVALSEQLAKEAGVADKARFVQGDMYEADLSQATVLALYLLPVNLNRLAPKFLDLKPGTRIVVNTFAIDEWAPDERQEGTGTECQSWCEVLLWIVPAKVFGTWQMGDGATLTLTQWYQTVQGTLTAGGVSTAISSGRLRGEQIRFVAGGADYTGTVSGGTMQGTVRSGRGDAKWTATRAAP